MATDSEQMKVVEMNSTNYDTCNSDNPIMNWTRGVGRDVVPLNVTRPLYFVSGKGFCYGRMKMAINVETSQPPPVAAPAYKGKIVLPAVLAIGTMWDAFLHVW